MILKILIRHGQSIRNVAMKPYYESGDTSGFTPELLALGESNWHLTDAGIAQADSPNG